MIKTLNLEKIVLGLLTIGFVVGIWHALPILNVVNDEMYYVGGALRAMENHTIIPKVDDVPYGTLTYIINYIFSGFTIAVLMPFFGFSLSSLKLFLIQNPSVMYLVLRFTSVLFSVSLLYFINRLLKKELLDIKVRLFLLILLFTNIITAVLLHTGKMWVLSILLVIISFYYLYKSLHENLDETDKRKNILLTILFSFLALSNFPLNFYSLVCVPILLFYFRRDKQLPKQILVYSVVGLFVYILITLFNFQGIKNQIVSIFSEYHPVVGEEAVDLNFFKSLYVYLVKIVLLFPLFLLTFLFSIKNGIRNKKLFYISIIYFSLYLLFITIIANWTTDLKSSLRYLFPLGFFLVILLSSLNFQFYKIFYIVGVVSIIYYCFTLYYLSIPTTYNKAYAWVRENLSDNNIIIKNNVPELQLIKNKESNLLTKKEYCGSKCKNIINHNLNNNFQPIVLDLLSVNNSINDSNYIYLIRETKLDDNKHVLIISFEADSDSYYSVDYNIGNYFDIKYLTINTLGKNIYIYKKFD